MESYQFSQAPGDVPSLVQGAVTWTCELNPAFLKMLLLGNFKTQKMKPKQQ